MQSRHIAIDLGASGGRVALGTIENGILHTEVLHRFPNAGTSFPTGLYWDHIAIWREILHGLNLAGERGRIDTVGANSWGVDYALLDENGLLLDGIHHYRDPRTDHSMDQVFQRVPRKEIYRRTGIQFMPLNTIFQLVAHEVQAPEILTRAKRLLFVPDFIHHLLCGSTVSERTISSTSQLYDPRSRDWDRELADRCGIPPHLLANLVDPGTTLGDVRPEIGLPGAKVIAPASHDTASAVAAVPAEGDRWAYISSGTWALAGIESPNPVVNDDTLQLNLTNEAGIAGTTRLLKNITGLWILQECRKAWGDPDYETLYAEADAAKTEARIDPDAAVFQQPCADMPERVQRFCRELGHSAPEKRGQIVRCIFESLAERAAVVMHQLESVAARSIETIHIVGGGSQIRVLNQLIADTTRCKVIAGPVDATLTGNLLIQAEAFGSIAKGSIRTVVRESEQLQSYEPL